MVHPTIEWYVMGPGVWISSFLSIVISFGVIIVYAFKNKKRMLSKASIYAYLIATSGIMVVFMHQFHFVKEKMSPFAPEFLQPLKTFSITKTCLYLEEFFHNIFNLLLMLDCGNRYILICMPHLKERLFNKRSIGMSFAVAVAVSSLLAGLSAKMESDTQATYISYNFWKISLERSPWFYCAIFKFLVSVLICGTMLFFTIKVDISLKKSIQFHMRSNTNPTAVYKYGKVRYFSTAICMLMVAIDFVARNILMGFEIRRHILVTSLFYYPLISTDGSVYRREMVIAITKISLMLLMSLKPGLYGLAYLWVKLP